MAHTVPLFISVTMVLSASPAQLPVEPPMGGHKLAMWSGSADRSLMTTARVESRSPVPDQRAIGGDCPTTPHIGHEDSDADGVGDASDTLKGCTAPASSIVTWWKAEGDATDVTGANDGTLLNGATFDAGQVGQAFSFDGMDDLLSAPGSGTAPTTSVTVECWIKLTTTAQQTSSGLGIMAKGVDQHVPQDFALTINAAKLRPHVTRGGTWHFYDCNSVLAANTWYHVAMVYDGSFLRGYVNGV